MEGRLQRSCLARYGLLTMTMWMARMVRVMLSSVQEEIPSTRKRFLVGMQPHVAWNVRHICCMSTKFLWLLWLLFLKVLLFIIIVVPVPVLVVLVVVAVVVKNHAMATVLAELVCHYRNLLSESFPLSYLLGGNWAFLLFFLTTSPHIWHRYTHTQEKNAHILT